MQDLQKVQRKQRIYCSKVEHSCGTDRSCPIAWIGGKAHPCAICFWKVYWTRTSWLWVLVQLHTGQATLSPCTPLPCYKMEALAASHVSHRNVRGRVVGCEFAEGVCVKKNNLNGIIWSLTSKALESTRCLDLVAASYQEEQGYLLTYFPDRLRPKLIHHFIYMRN